MELEQSLRRVKEIVSRPENLYRIESLDDPDDYQPRADGIYFKVGNGLLIYEPQGVCLELKAALGKGDLPERPKQDIEDQWRYLAELGYHTVYSIVLKENLKTRLMCRAMGMELKTSGETINAYTKVINNG